MKKLKLTFLKWATGKFGPLLTPILAGVIGTAVASFYVWFGELIHKYPTIESFFMDIWNNLDPATQGAFDPKIIGAAVAVASYAVIQELLNKYFVEEVKRDQEAINEIIEEKNDNKRIKDVVEPVLTVDGFLGPKTRMAKNKVLAAAQVAIRDRLT
jgi:hypothetical protein